jgi:catechol 2,3-dioxygenase-like lactoylglutathione lyase family enzyme
MALRITRVDHVQITVPREVEGAALQFYGDVLGLERIPKPPEAAKRGGAWFRLGAVQVHVSVENVDAAQRESRRHVCYAVDNLDEARSALQSAGVAILEDPRPEPGLSRFYVFDPGGNRIEIAAFLG